jgi:hypothetical protein
MSTHVDFFRASTDFLIWSRAAEDKSEKEALFLLSDKCRAIAERLLKRAEAEMLRRGEL